MGAACSLEGGLTDFTWGAYEKIFQNVIVFSWGQLLFANRALQRLVDCAGLGLNPNDLVARLAAWAGKVSRMIATHDPGNMARIPGVRVAPKHHDCPIWTLCPRPLYVRQAAPIGGAMGGVQSGPTVMSLPKGVGGR